MDADTLFLQKPQRINRVELIMGIGLATAAIIIFNVYPEAIGLVPEDEAWLFPLLDPNFAIHIPWLTASWGLEIGLKSLVLVEGRWRWTSRFFEFLLGILSVYIAYRMLTGGPLIAFSPLEWPVTVALWLAVIFGSISTAVKGTRLLVGYTGSVVTADK